LKAAIVIYLDVIERSMPYDEVERLAKEGALVRTSLIVPHQAFEVAGLRRHEEPRMIGDYTHLRCRAVVVVRGLKEIYPGFSCEAEALLIVSRASMSTLRTNEALFTDGLTFE
jgi:hypothetical protein